MVRTTVYLNQGEAEGLRRVAAATGRSQAELIREGVRRVVAEAPPRPFHSMGKGQGPPYAPPDPDGLLADVMGRRRPG